MPEPQKTFTQDDVNGFLAKERKRWEAERAELKQAVVERDAVIDAAKARIPELESEVATVASERDSLRASLDSSAAAHAEALVNMERKVTDMIGAHRSAVAGTSMTQALVAARVVPEATRFAVAELMRAATLEQNEAGDVVAVTYADNRYPSAVKAAEAFLREHPYLALPPLGGSGTPRRFSGPATPKRDITKEDPAKLADEGWRSELAR